jgi:hypothetical protein
MSGLKDLTKLLRISGPVWRRRSEATSLRLATCDPSLGHMTPNPIRRKENQTLARWPGEPQYYLRAPYKRQDQRGREKTWDIRGFATRLKLERRQCFVWNSESGVQVWIRVTYVGVLEVFGHDSSSHRTHVCSCTQSTPRGLRNFQSWLSSCVSSGTCDIEHLGHDQTSACLSFRIILEASEFGWLHTSLLGSRSKAV